MSKIDRIRIVVNGFQTCNKCGSTNFKPHKVEINTVKLCVDCGNRIQSLSEVYGSICNILNE